MRASRFDRLDSTGAPGLGGIAFGSGRISLSFCCNLVQQEAIIVGDERSRHELYRRLEEVLGPDAATTLIEHLPPVGWADVATKHDLAGLEQRVDLRFTVLEKRIDDRFAVNEERTNAAVSEVRATLERELRSQSTTMIFGLVGIVLTMAALAVALVRLT